ncbi:MAG TPA: hypothetical protein VFF81_11130 [Noviherbaspirillum sp.]|nr:hypothetical protein [Noviherbaspirillum sp.]
MRSLSRTIAFALLATSGLVAAQELDTHFSCSVAREVDGERVIYADNGTFRLKGERIETFHWESALYRTTHGFDCSIDESDGLKAEVRDEKPKASWRVALKDARAARYKRGFTFDRGMSCTIRVEREGETMKVTPTCPALCGSRPNFSALSVDLKTGECRYEE